MKHIKMLGLAAMAAMALTAFGASTASATDLYSTGVKLPVGTTLHMTLEPGTTSLSETTDGSSSLTTCSVSTAHGNISSTGGAAVIVNIGILLWGPGCTATTDTLTNGTLQFNSAGTVTGSGSVWTKTIGVSCRYGTGGGTHLGTLKTGALKINAIINEQEPKQFLCPDTTRWTASFIITTPHDVHAT